MNAAHAAGSHRRLRTALIAMSAFAVVSDAVLIAFYPQFFERRYGVTSAMHVGAYIAAISVAVMCTLPLWARLERRVETLRLLMVTQFAAGLLCLFSHFAETAAGYWALTMLMFMCKSSYLLMYPYLMRLEPPESHAHTIGLLSVVVHFGSILGAVVGGWALQSLGPAACVAIMAAGDWAQMLVCVWLVRSGKADSAALRARPLEDEEAGSPPDTAPRFAMRVMQLCMLMMLVDFSAHVTSPFFSVHWESLMPGGGSLASGLVFAIPGGMALLALFVNHHASRRGHVLSEHVLLNLLLGGAGLFLQAAPDTLAVLAGRVMYGWALFQIVVRYEVMLFRASTPSRYASDFGTFNFFQNLGVLVSSFAAGALVQRYGTGLTFGVGAAGFLVTAALHRLGTRRGRSLSQTESAAPLGEAHAG